MSNFNILYRVIIGESKFRKLENELIQNVKQVAKKYEETFKIISPRNISKVSQELTKDSKYWSFYKDEKVRRFAQLATFSFIDLEKNKKKKVKVIVAFGGNTHNAAVYRDDVDVMTLFHDNIKHYTTREIEALIVHEITHGFQQYKNVSDEYSSEVEKISKGLPYDKKVYSKEPVEFDSHMTSIGFAINDIVEEFNSNIKNSKTPEVKKILQMRLDKFLLEFKLFIRSNINTYTSFEELTMPAFLQPYEDFIISIFNNSRLRNKLKQSLTSLYHDITGKYP